MEEHGEPQAWELSPDQGQLAERARVEIRVRAALPGCTWQKQQIVT